MNETNGVKIGDLLRPLLLGKKGNVCGVETMEVLGVKLPKEVDEPHKIYFNNVPTLPEKSFGKPIGTGSLIDWQIFNGTSNPILGERSAKVMLEDSKWSSSQLNSIVRELLLPIMLLK
jgi:hypothetical protein